MHYSFVAHTRWPHAPLAERASAKWLWGALRPVFPSALAAVLMPNHLHLVAATRDPAVELARLRAVLGAYARAFGVGWNRVPDPKPLPTLDKVLREIRYVSLNPCRPARVGMDQVTLVADPLAWEWSTHRDAVGAIVDPWVSAERIAEETGQRPADPIAWLHRYVSSDPSVAVQGTAVPHPTTVETLTRAAFASAAAHRADPDAILRRGPVRATFLGVAERFGYSAAEAAARTELHPASARKGMRDADPRIVEPALLCLDTRLLVRTDYAPAPSSRAVGLAGVSKLRTGT